MEPAALPHLPPTLSEAELAAAAGHGDRDAFEQLYRRHVDRIYALCLRLCADADQAEQFVQDAFVRAWSKLPGFRGESGFGTWLHRLTVNVVLDRLRARARRWRREALLDPLTEMTAAAAGRPVADAAVGERVDLARALARLPAGARTAFVLHEVEGYPVRDVADLMQVSAGTVKTQLYRARHQLREVLR